MNATLLYAGNSLYVKFIDEVKEDLVFTYENATGMLKTVNELLSTVKENGINILNKGSFKFFESDMSETLNINESIDYEAEQLLEFEMFNVTRRDIVSFGEFMKSAADASNVIKSGNNLSTRKFQMGFTHEITRDDTFKHPMFDSAYKSLGASNDPTKREDAENAERASHAAAPTVKLVGIV